MNRLLCLILTRCTRYAHRDNQGINARVKVVKNKVAPPFRSVDVDIFFGSGMDTWGSLVDAAETMGILTRRGSWYFYGTSLSLCVSRVQRQPRLMWRLGTRL